MKAKMKQKGFTLIELIIVLAIIGVLTAILIPSWNYMISRSRIRTQNGYAKVIFNAAQSAAIDLQVKERNMAETDKYMTSGEFYFYWDGTTGTAVNNTGDVSGLDDNGYFSRVVNRLYDGDGIYRVYINNYIVQSVVSSRFAADRYIGAYPVNTDALEDIDSATESKLEGLGAYQTVDQLRNRGVANLSGDDMLNFCMPSYVSAY